MNRSYRIFGRTQVGVVVADILGATASRTFASRALAAGAIALIGVGAGHVAHAQEASSAADSSAGAPSVEEVTVTGSRIRRTTDFDTPNPTTVVDGDYLKKLGIVNVGDAVKQLPSNISNNSPTTTGNSNFFIGSTIANLRGLNPYFGSRTLNLVNNRRFVPTNQGDGVDLNFIPSIMIDRVDIVTGGASAAYGSGAISGVNNIFLDRKLEGGKAQVDFAETGQGDGDDKHLGLAYGSSLFDGRGHFVLGYEFEDLDAVGCYNARDWCREGNGFYQAGLNNFILGSNIRQNQISNTGVFYTKDPTRTQTFQGNAAGNGTMPFNLGQQPFAAGQPTNAVPGGDGRSIYEYTNLRSPVKRNVAAGTFTFKVTDTTNLSVDLSYGKVESTNVTGATDATNQRILTDNAFIQNNTDLLAAAAATQLNPTNGQTFGAYSPFNKDWTSQVDSFTDFTTEVKRAAVGFDGLFGESSWSWDAYYQYGETNRDQYVNDARHLVSYLMATDSVIDNRAGSSTFGQAVCRVTRDGYAAASAANPTYGNLDPAVAASLAQGCVPLNPLGNGQISQAAHDYAFGFLDEQLDYTQQVVAGSVSGDLWEGFGAGPVQTALGLEYRKEKGENLAAQGISDDVRRDFPTQYGESFGGDVKVTEGFVETNIPVLKGVTGAQKLEFNTAARLSKYENQGGFGTTGESRTHNIFTWKIAGIWDPIDWLRIRASQSRDSRAANFRELYYRQVIASGGSFGYCGAPGSNTDPCTLDLRGNTNLAPEKSDTTTIGFVLTPKEVLPGFQFAADYFRINVMDAINQASSRTVIDGCNKGKGDMSLCDDLVLGTPTDPSDPYSNIEQVNGFAYNGKGYLYKGIDFSGSYQWDIDDANSLYFRLIGTHMLDQKYQATDSLPEYNVVGQTGTANSFLSDNQPTAKWVTNFQTTFTHGPVNVTGSVRFVSEGTFNYRGVTANPDGTFPTIPIGGASLSDNHVPSYAVVALNGSYDLENVPGVSSLQLFATIDNLFDRDPPIAAGNGANGNGGTNPIFFDTLGRQFRVGVRMNF